jgi:hypothetical protein
MKHIGVREFKNRATHLFKDAEPIAIERHGRLIGFYIPVDSEEDEDARVKAALSRLEGAVSRALEETGLTEDELADHLDLSKPMPDAKRED